MDIKLTNKIVPIIKGSEFQRDLADLMLAYFILI